MDNSYDEEFIELFQEDNGVHKIRQDQYLLLADSTDMYKCAKRWIVLSPTTLKDRTSIRRECLLKSYIYDKRNGVYKVDDRKILKANNFIIPEIARAFGLQSATYARFVIDDDFSGELGREENIAGMYNRRPIYKLEPKKEYILTPSFLDTDEQFIAFGNIISDDKEMRVSVIWKQIEKFLVTRNISKEDIKNIKKQYAIKSIFGAFVELNDNHNYNDGLIVSNDRSERDARLAPAYDLDYSMGVYNVAESGFPIVHVKTASNGRYELTDMLKEFKNVLTEKDISQIMDCVDPNKTTKIVEETDKEYNLHLTDDVKKRYQKFFREKFEEMQIFYREQYGKDYEI